MDKMCKDFFGVQVLNDVSFELEGGTILGLIGENGAGKSTLMNLLGGVHQASSGKMFLEEEEYKPKNPLDAIRNGIAFIHQELNLFPNLTVSENIYIEKYSKYKFVPFLKKREMIKNSKQLLEDLGLSINKDVLVSQLSPGERQLVEVAKALKFQPKIVIFDEPTTSLTERESDKLFKTIEKLKQEGKAIIYISHILEHVKRISDKTLVLRNGVLADYGNTKDFTFNRMIKAMINKDLSMLYPEYIKREHKYVKLEIKNLSKRNVVKDVSFSLKSGEILGIFGLMGAGRTELLKILFGLDSYDEGEVYINGDKVKKLTARKSVKNKIGYITEDRREEGLLMNATIVENVSLVSLPQYRNKLTRSIEKRKMIGDIQEVVNKLQLKSDNICTFMAKSLSGGNQQKVVISKWLLSNPEILIFDEPTRGIDIGAKTEVYKIITSLVKNNKSILLVSSEIEELIGMCDRIIVMSKGEQTAEFERKEFDKGNILKASFNQ